MELGNKKAHIAQIEVTRTNVTCFLSYGPESNELADLILKTTKRFSSRETVDEVSMPSLSSAQNVC